MNKIWLFVICFLYLILLIKSQSSTKKYRIPLDHEDKVLLEWYENYDRIYFTLNFTILRLPFTFGFGFSDYGAFKNADLVVLNNDNFYDCYTDENGVLTGEGKTDYEPTDYNIIKLSRGYQITVEFNRKIDTCDENDYLIDRGTTHVIHFISYDKNFESKFSDGNFKPERDSDSKDMKMVQLLRKSEITNFDDDNQYSYFDITNKNVKIPDDDTVYWCLVHKLDPKFRQKHQITRFEGIIDPKNQGVVHHMELFHCIYDPPAGERFFSDVCTSEEKPRGLTQCRNVIAAWAMGASPFIYPKDVGGPIGGRNYSMYLVLEIHYDNKHKRNDIIDSSGIRIYYTGPRNLRKYDAGIMEVGLEYNPKNSIPPSMNQFILNGYCLSDCTKLGINPGGIKVFASQLHTHLTGRKVVTTVVRRNGSSEILNYDYHYNPMFQEIRLLERPVTVYPGDTIINSCVYETLDRKSMTFGGYGIYDEMCVNYMHYYPATALELCKTSIRDDVLEVFFEKMGEYDYADTSPRKTVQENFDSIRWTPLTASILDTLYNTAALSFSCNASDGSNLFKRPMGLRAFNFKPILTSRTGTCEN